MKIKLLLLGGFAGLASCTKAEAAAPVEVGTYIDAKRHVACYTVHGPQLSESSAVAISCVALPR
jgi:hypothetical protein